MAADLFRSIEHLEWFAKNRPGAYDVGFVGYEAADPGASPELLLAACQSLRAGSPLSEGERAAVDYAFRRRLRDAQMFPPGLMGSLERRRDRREAESQRAAINERLRQIEARHEAAAKPELSSLTDAGKTPGGPAATGHEIDR